jgi:site-specific recombinase XerD
MSAPFEADFKRRYATLEKHLRLKGFRRETIEAYARGVRRIAGHFDYQIDDLSAEQLTNYFAELLGTHSWASVKLDLYGLKFYYEHVLRKPWGHVDLIKPPRGRHLPDIVTVEEVARLVQSTRVLSYRVLFFTLYSMGLRLGEGLGLTVADIDAARRRVHIRDAKGRKDRLVPLPEATLVLLRRFWAVHRHRRLLFPNRKGGLKGAATAPSPLAPVGAQTTLAKVVASCGIKKRSLRTVCAIIPHAGLCRCLL